MRVLVCIKRVPAPGARINITADGLAVDTAFLGFTMSPHEECAVEEAVQIVERNGGTSTVLTLGPVEADEQLRYAASLGVNEAILIPTDGLDWDAQRTATAIASAISAAEETGGDFDVILFGNESADSGGFQVGIRVAHKLARPVVNGIKGIAFSTSADGAAITVAKRESEGGHEIYHVPMPAVLGVKEGINLPRYPTMKGRLSSKKVVVVQHQSDAPAGGQHLVALQRPAEQASRTVVLGTGVEAAPAIVDLLTELGLV